MQIYDPCSYLEVEDFLPPLLVRLKKIYTKNRNIPAGKRKYQCCLREGFMNTLSLECLYSHMFLFVKQAGL